MMIDETKSEMAIDVVMVLTAKSRKPTTGNSAQAKNKPRAA